MLNFSDKKKEYLRITTRFLKEVGLYDLWLKYCYEHSKKYENWLETLDEKITIQEILGDTNFTNFVKGHRKLDLKGYYIYEIFGEFLLKTNSEYCDELDEYSYSINMLDVNIEGKKVTWTEKKRNKC